MSARFTGSFGKLQDLSDRLSAAASSGAREVNRVVAIAVEGQLEKQYATGTSPGGQTWRNKVDGTRSYLQKTTRMRKSTTAVAGVQGVTVTAPKPAGFHQSGTVNMAQRRIVPDSLDKAPAWREAVQSAVREVVLGSLK